MARAYVLLAAICFGTTGTAQALGPEASPLSVGAARIAVGAALLMIAARAVSRPRGRLPLLPVLVGGACVAVYQVGFFAAVSQTGVAVGTVVAIGSVPVVAGPLARLVNGEPLERRWALATALACAGMAVLVLGGGGAAQASAGGMALAVLAGAATAGYAVSGKRMIAAGRGPEEVMAGMFGLGAALLSPVLLLGPIGWLASPGGLALAIYLGLVPTAIAYVLFGRGLQRVSASEASTLVLAEPLTAAALGVLALGERPGAGAAAGAALVLAGLAVLSLPSPRARVKAPYAAGAAARRTAGAREPGGEAARRTAGAREPGEAPDLTRGGIARA